MANFDDSFDAFPQAEVPRKSVFMLDYTHFGDNPRPSSLISEVDKQIETPEPDLEQKGGEEVLKRTSPNAQRKTEPTRLYQGNCNRTPPSGQGIVLLHIFTVTDRRHAIHIGLTETLEDLQKVVETETGIPAFQQVLLTNRQNLLSVLEPTTTIENSGLSNGSVIHLLVDIEGGRKWRRKKNYTTPKKEKRLCKDHAHTKYSFLNSWAVTEEQAERCIKEKKDKPQVRHYHYWEAPRKSESNFTKDSPPNSMDSMGNTPLCEAIEGKEWDTARELVSKRGANVNLPTYHLKETPLHLAVAANCRDFVQFLLENGANPCSKNAERNTPVDVAILKVLLDHGGYHTYESVDDIRDRKTQKELLRWLQRQPSEDEEKDEEVDCRERRRQYSFYAHGYDCTKRSKHHNL